MAITEVPHVLTADQAAVPVDSDVFHAHTDAAFYVGVAATQGRVLDSNLYHANGLLRTNVYVHQKGFLDENAIGPDGTEQDGDDARSIHFSVLENRGAALQPRLVGASRLIIKASTDDKLPLEHYFPDTLRGSQTPPPKSAEVSRFIARHPDGPTQASVSLALIRGMAAWLVNNEHGPAYATVERGLAVMFDRMRLPYESMTGFKTLAAYAGTRNKAIRIEPSEVLGRVQATQHVASPIVERFFADTATHQGLGYFGPYLTRAAA